MNILLYVMLINVLLGLIVSLLLGNQVKISIQKQGKGDIGNYIIPGFMGPSFKAYAPYIKYLEGDVKIIRYSNFGFIFRHIANRITKDIAKSGYQTVRIFSISMGDKIAQCVTAQSLSIIAINPCTQIDFVKNSVRRWINPITVGLWLGLLRVALGLLSYLPIIPKDGQVWSFAALEEQVSTIVFSNVPINQADTIGIILCQPNEEEDADEFLDNSSVRSAFQAQSITLKGCHHGDIINGLRSYQEALQEIL